MMVRRRSLVMATAAGGLIIVVAVIAQTFWGVGFGPAPPLGAVRLHIATEAPRLFPFGCTLALLLPVRVASTTDELTLVSVETGQPVPVVWPSGFAAWRVGGRAELVARDGTLVGREGDELDNLGGGVGGDDIFHVCIVGGHP